MEKRVGLHDTTDELNHTVSNAAESPNSKDLQRSISLGSGSGCRVATYSIWIPVTVVDLVVRGVKPNFSTWDRPKFTGLR